MARTASIVTAKVAAYMSDGSSGLAPVIANLSADAGLDLPVIQPESIVRQHAPVAVMERGASAKYPAVHIYVDRVQNLLTEKFRTFSGRVRTVAEIRVSQDRMEDLEEQLRLYVEAVTEILNNNRGCWDQGMFYAGGYEIKYEPIQHGGRNLLQVAKVIFEVDLSS